MAITIKFKIPTDPTNPSCPSRNLVAQIHNPIHIKAKIEFKKLLAGKILSNGKENETNKKRKREKIESDVWIISSDGIEIPAHWFVLRTRCDYFDGCWTMKQYQNQNDEEKKRVDGSDFDSKTWFQVSFSLGLG